ncbi:DapH/DapD/GlmU-related protein [Escherichia coli]
MCGRLVKTSTFPVAWHRRRAGAAAANPTIIEDNCFIGARSEAVEGVIVEEGSVISKAYTLVRAPAFTTVKPANPLRSRSGGVCGCFR